MIIKVGLLLDSMRAAAWKQHIIAYLQGNPSFSIQLVVLNTAAPNSNSRVNFVYRSFRKMDRKLFTTKHDCFQLVSLDESLSGIEVIHVNPVRTRFTDQLTDQDLTVINSRKLDILIRFGFRILKGGILQAAQRGVWSLHHGDNDVNRGGPPAFWEVVKGESTSGVTLQILSEELDGGRVIGKTFTRTDRTSFNRNQIALYWAGVELFCNSLHRLTDEGEAGRGKLPVAASSFYSQPLYRSPNNRQSLIIFAAFWIRRLKEVTREFFQKPRWSLYYALRNDSVETYLFRYKRLTSPAGTDWADPFIVFKENRYVVFFEELIYRQKKAHISCLEFDGSGKLISPKPLKVLEEPYHLSYPFTMEHDGHWYMLPEAASSNNVWLYRCEKFPNEWKRFSCLLADTSMYDPTLHFHDGTWYLFGTQKPFPGNSADQYLYIYYSKDLLSGSWNPHPQNPVTRDIRGARPAGKIFEREGKLIRPGQIGAPKYGYGTRFHEIIKLTPQEFEERPIGDILPDWQKGLVATHTFNAVKGFSVVDGQGF